MNADFKNSILEQLANEVIKLKDNLKKLEFKKDELNKAIEEVKSFENNNALEEFIKVYEKDKKNLDVTIKELVIELQKIDKNSQNQDLNLKFKNLNDRIKHFSDKLDGLDLRIDNLNNGFVTRKAFLTHIESNNKNFKFFEERINTDQQDRINNFERVVNSLSNNINGYDSRYRDKFDRLEAIYLKLKKQVSSLWVVNLILVVIIVLGIIISFSLNQIDHRIIDKENSDSIKSDQFNIEMFNKNPVSKKSNQTKAVVVEIPGIEGQTIQLSHEIIKGRTWVSDPEIRKSSNSYINFHFYESQGSELKPYQIKANEYIKEWTHQRNGYILNQDYFKKQLKSFLDFYISDCNSCEWQVTIEIDERFSNFISVSSEEFIYTGGAHWLSNESHYNINRTSGKIIDFHDIVTDTINFNRIAERYFREYTEIPSHQSLSDAGYWFKNNRFTCSKNFFFDDFKINFVFNQYKVAPFAFGRIKFSIPIDEIKHLLNLDLSYMDS